MYPNNIASNINPSIVDIFKSIARNATKSNVIQIRNGKSCFKTLFSTFNSLKSAVIPIINRILKRLLPTIFPIAIELLPARDEAIETAASGALVPNATIVNPTIIVGIFKRYAILLDPSTNKSDPLIKNTNPAIYKTI